jgi:hypothetical protein
MWPFDKKEVDYGELVKGINAAVDMRYEFSKPFFDSGNRNRNLINVYAAELMTCIDIMSNENTQKKTGVNKAELLMRIGGKVNFQDRFVRAHDRLKDMYIVAFSLARKDIDEKYRDYIRSDAKNRSQDLGNGKVNNQMDPSRIYFENARRELLAIQRNQAFRYITRVDKSGEVLTAYNDTVSALRGVFKNLGIHVDF